VEDEGYDLRGAALAGLLSLVGTLAIVAGVWSLFRPIERIGIADRKRAGQVIGVGVLVGLVGGALAGPVEEPAAVAPIGAIVEGTTTTATSPLPTTTTLVDPIVTVIEVVDGDTVVVETPDGTEETVRLIGIDAPDGNEDGTVEAAEALAAFIGGDPVTLTEDVSDRDRFGRLLRYLWVGDRLVNEELVAAGFATAARFPPDIEHAGVHEAAQQAAEMQALGLWATTTTTTSSTTSTTTTTTTTTTTVVVAAPTTTEAQCHPSYVGQCVPIGVSDVDCRGGSGNGPYYTGRVQVVGYDEYGLDGDNDGIGCESS
jgi:micrococcal nuclease